MAYKKPLVTTTVYYHNGTDPIVFEDAIDNGTTYRYGSTAREQLLRGDAVDSMAEIESAMTKVIIPYHAVIYATVTIADSEEQTEPEDDFCK